MYPGEKAKGVPDILFLKRVDVWLLDYPTIQQKPGIKMGLSLKSLWRWLLSNGVNPRDRHKRPARLLRILYQEKHCHLQETQDRLKESWQTPKIPQAVNRRIKRITLSIERKDNLKGKALHPEARAKDLVARAKDSVARAKDPEARAPSHRLWNLRIHLPVFWNCLESAIPFFFF